MQRLFSIFPTGSAGVALVVLRSVVAVTVFAQMRTYSTIGAVILTGLVAVVGLCLLLGFLTPYCAALSCLIEFTPLVMPGRSEGFQLGMSALTAGSLAVLGPGAYSVDAKIFGRQLITLPRKDPH